MPGKGTMDAIFILRQLHEKYIMKKKDMYFIFVDLEKAFDRVPRVILWWSMRKLGVEEWLIQIIQAMYENARSKVRLKTSYSPEFDVNVGVHQGSVLSPLLFAIVMEAISMEFREGCPSELLYADDLVITAHSLEELKERYQCWKDNLEAKGLKVNILKTKILMSKSQMPTHVGKSKFPCGVCMKGVGRNSIFCNYCQKWVHQKCTDIKLLKEDPNFKCKRCVGDIVSYKDDEKEILIGNDSLEVVNSFCYLGDVIDQVGGCAGATTARIRSAWKSFHELLPVLTTRSISLRKRGEIFQSCVRSVLLYASETWPVKVEDVDRIIRNDNIMVRWICSVKLSERKSMDNLRNMLGIRNIDVLLRYNRLRWYGHTLRMNDSAWPKKIMNYDINGVTPRGGQKKRWIHNINKDLQKFNLSQNDAKDRAKWRKTIHPKSQQEDIVQPP